MEVLAGSVNARRVCAFPGVLSVYELCVTIPPARVSQLLGLKLIAAFQNNMLKRFLVFAASVSLVFIFCHVVDEASDAVAGLSEFIIFVS